MVKILFIIQAIIAILGIQSCSKHTDKHIGEWRDQRPSHAGSLILDKTNHAVLVYKNQALGGDNFEVRGKECKYEIDYNKNPIWLDLVIYEKDKPDVRFKGIMRFLTDNKMEYRMAFGGERFDNFDPEDKEFTIILDRVTN